MIHICDCYHPGQDSIHGIGRRVYNLMGKDGAKARCTICGKIVSLSGDVIKANKESKDKKK